MFERGGIVYDLIGNYDCVWGVSIALGIVAALVNWPIKEHAIVRRQPAAAGG